MANKKVTDSNNPLVDVHFKISKTEKDFLDNLGESASGFIRKLIDAQMSGHEVEIAELKEEKRQKEAELNIIIAQLSELDAADQRKQAASQNRKQLIEDILKRLIEANRILDFKDNGFLQRFNNNLNDANRVLNGSGEPITPDELKERLITKARTQKRGIYV